MYNLDPINLQARPNTVYAEGLTGAARITPEQGRLLGLRAGQVINGVIAQRPEGNVLLFDNKALPLPTSIGSAGERIGLQVVMLGGQMMVRRLTDLKAPIANPSLPSTQGSERLSRLTMDIGQLQLARFFSPASLQELAQHPQLKPVLQQLSPFLLSANALQGGDIKRLMEHSGLFSEAAVRFNQAAAAASIKSVLMDLRRILLSSGGDVTQLNGAIDELEGRQVETLGHQLQRHTQLSWLLPFHDQAPVFLQISRDDGSTQAADREKIKSGWRVDLTVPWGEQEVAANIHYADGKTNVKFWAASAQLAEQVTAGEEHLRRLLRKAGVELQDLVVFPGQRPAVKNDDLPTARRLSVDV